MSDEGKRDDDKKRFKKRQEQKPFEEWSDSERAQYQENARQDYISNLMLEYHLEPSAEALARYIEAGGLIDRGVRDEIVRVLRGELKRDKGAPERRWRDLEVYCTISGMIAASEVYFAFNPQADGKPFTKTRACQVYAESKNRALRTVEVQFERGQKIQEQLDAMGRRGNAR